MNGMRKTLHENHTTSFRLNPFAILFHLTIVSTMAQWLGLVWLYAVLVYSFGYVRGRVMQAEHWQQRLVHINDLKVGDGSYTKVLLFTVSKTNLRRGGFMGTTFMGDSYRAGSDLVTLLVPPLFVLILTGSKITTRLVSITQSIQQATR